jgi:hypothetical protein
MRELANLTTRGAIDKHAHGRWSKMAVGKMIGGSLSLLCGIWLTFFLENWLGWFSRVAGIAGIAAGGFWIFQGAMFVRNVRTATRRANKSAGHESAGLDAPTDTVSEDDQNAPAPINELAAAASPESDRLA